ncbi:MAG: GGDEF domain-containing protein [Bdellovibrio sp.]|nr:GGDEF domain-containing protein [Methylotenera sp.]
MALLRITPSLEGTWGEVLLAPFFLVSLTTPLIYFFIVKPFVDERDETVVDVNYKAHSDALTNLANRRLVLDYLSVILTNNAKNHNFAAVLVIDLDGFKPVNDIYGHEAGDAVLMNVAERLKACVRSEDLVGRIGGDEFIILLKLSPDKKIARYVARSVADKIIKQVADPVIYYQQTLAVTASVGIRLFKVGLNPQQIISDADKAMYRAKEAGRACAVFFDDTLI